MLQSPDEATTSGTNASLTKDQAKKLQKKQKKTSKSNNSNKGLSGVGDGWTWKDQVEMVKWSDQAINVSYESNQGPFDRS